MPYLKTKSLTVGSEHFVLSEFTALNRLQDLQYSVDCPSLDKPNADATDDEKLKYGLEKEMEVLNQVAHSIALSLSHELKGEAGGRSVTELQQMVMKQWPNAAVNAAYEILKALNSPEELNKEPESAVDSDIELTPEKS
ncbi:hypothetical protein A6E13_16575 [Aliivibrio fischeri]|uniref:phage minor tail protein domain-containing protein n=1 Tax=Aliivibrio fischeri TaxID=668 RepID=UPI00080E4DD1|nr:phage minor tail protein G [Aliivibrio fischeri]OCH31836.1 hypothetical protein A6E13_16575 [Aliivibrio fischeri]